MKVNFLNELSYLWGINDIILKELLVLPKPGRMTNRLLQLQQRPDLNIQATFRCVSVVLKKLMETRLKSNEIMQIMH